MAEQDSAGAKQVCARAGLGGGGGGARFRFFRIDTAAVATELLAPRRSAPKSTVFENNVDLHEAIKEKLSALWNDDDEDPLFLGESLALGYQHSVGDSWSVTFEDYVKCPEPWTTPGPASIIRMRNRRTNNRASDLHIGTKARKRFFCCGHMPLDFFPHADSCLMLSLVCNVIVGDQLLDMSLRRI